MGTEVKSDHSYRKQLDSLYNDERELKAIHRDKGTNAGLWLDKYIKNQSQDDTDSRSGLVREVSEIAISDTYRQFYKHWEQGLTDVGARKRFARANGRIVIGLGDESVLETSITLHHTYGVPYIPGSALKGLAASYARQRLEEKDWGKESSAYQVVFGDTSEAGCVTFFDALLHIDPQEASKPVLYQDIITVHHPDYYRGANNAVPADWDSPTPIPFLSAKGEYLVALAAPDLYHGQTWLNKTFEILERALRHIGIGAKTSSGYGRMTLQEELIVDPEMVKLIEEIKNLPDKAFSSGSIDKQLILWLRYEKDPQGKAIAQAIVDKVNSSGNAKQVASKTQYQRLLATLR